MVWLADGERSVMIRLAVWIEYRRVTDRQTDSIVSAMRSIAR